MFFKNSKTALEVEKFKELENVITDNSETDKSDIDHQSSPVEQVTVYADTDSNSDKRVITSYKVLNIDDAKFELLVHCNDGSMWIYKHGPKHKWTQLPDVPQG